MPQTGDDSDIAFGKFLIARDILTTEQVRENYQRLVDYRQSLGSNVNLAQVLARHEVATKEVLRDAFQQFSAGAPAAPAEAKPFGFKTVELNPDDQPPGSAFSPIAPPPKSAIGSAFPPPSGSAFPTGAGSAFPAAPPGSNFAPLAPFGAGIPPTIEPEGPGFSDFGDNPTVLAGGPGSAALREGPGSTHRMRGNRGPGGTHAQSGGQSGGGLFDASGSDGPFPSSRRNLLDLIPASGPPPSDASEDQDEDEPPVEDAKDKRRADTNVDSSTYGGLRKRSRSRHAPPSSQRGGLPLGVMLAVGVGLVLAISIGVGLFLRSRARAEAKAYFLTAAREKPPVEALEIGESLDESLQTEDHEVAEAIRVLRERVAADARRAEAEAILAKLPDAADLEERLEICNQAVEVDETFGRAFAERARVKYGLAKHQALAQGKGNSREITRGALEDLQRAISCDTKSAWPYYVRADVLLEAGRDPDSRSMATQDLKRAASMEPGTALAHLADGRREFLDRKLDKAIEQYDHALDKDPQLLDAYLARAEARLAQGEHAGALRDANQACDSDANSARALTIRARARFNASKDRDGALADLKRALDLDPTLGAALALRAYVRIERDSSGQITSKEDVVKQAAKDADQALLLDATLPLAHMAKAEALWAQDDVSQAIASARKAITHSFRFAEAYLLLARLKTVDGDYDHAALDLDKVLNLEHDNPRALTMKAQILIQRRDFDQASSLLEQALELDRNMPQAFFSRAYLNLNSRRPNRRKAIEDLSEALGLRPTFSEAYFYRAAAYHDDRRFGDALKDLDQAEALRKSSRGAFSVADVNLIRGHCHFERQEWKAANAAYDQYLKLAPVGSTAIQKVRNRKKECEKNLAGQ